MRLTRAYGEMQPLSLPTAHLARAWRAGGWNRSLATGGAEALLREAAAQKITPTQEASSQITRMIPMITPIRMRPMVSPCVPSRRRTPHAGEAPRGRTAGQPAASV